MNELQRALSHTLFIGGTTDAGKTSIARAIAGRRSWRCYHGDKHELHHLIKRTQRQPELWSFLTEDAEQSSIATGQGILLAHQSLKGFRERFMYCVEDLFLLDHGQDVIAEGRNFTPELVAPVLQSKHQAIWLVPSDDFFRRSTELRNKRPAYIERDLVLRDHMKQQAEIQGLTVLEVDGGKDVTAIAALDEPMLAPKERDLMFIGGGIGGIWNTAQEIQWFYHGYGPTEIDLVALSYYRYERIVVDIAETAARVFGMHGSSDERQKGLGLANQFLPNNVVDIAHRTYQQRA